MKWPFSDVGDFELGKKDEKELVLVSDSKVEMMVVREESVNIARGSGLQSCNPAARLGNYEE